MNVLTQVVTVVVPMLAFNRTHQATVEKPKRGTARYKIRSLSSLTSHPVYLYYHRIGHKALLPGMEVGRCEFGRDDG